MGLRRRPLELLSTIGGVLRGAPEQAPLALLWAELGFIIWDNWSLPWGNS